MYLSGPINEIIYPSKSVVHFVLVVLERGIPLSLLNHRCISVLFSFIHNTKKIISQSNIELIMTVAMNSFYEHNQKRLVNHINI